MKDLTHYFQFPTKEKENTSQKENVGVTTLNDSCTEADSKIYKRLSKSYDVAEKSSVSLSSLEMKNSLHVRNSSKRIRSKQRINSSVSNDVDNNSLESVEFDRHCVILQSKEDISISQRTPCRTSGEKFHNETSCPQTTCVGKQKEKKKLSLSLQKVSNSDGSKSLSVRTEVLNEIVIEESPKKKKNNLLFQEDSICSPSVTLNSVDSSKNKAGKSCTKGTTKKERLNVSLQKSVKCVDMTKHGSETDVTNKPSDKISPILNENTNAFHVLMSSRIWHSPHDQSSDEAENHNVCTSPYRKCTQTVVAETPMKISKIKANKKKRKKLENMADKRRMKKAKLSDTSSERIVIISESDSDDRNTALDQGIDILKTKGGDKQVHRECDKMAVEGVDHASAELCNENKVMTKHDKVVNQDNLASKKLATNTLRNKDRNGSNVFHKNSRKLVIEENEGDYSDLLKKEDKIINQGSLTNSKLSTRSSKKMTRNGSSVLHKASGKLMAEETEDICSEPEQDCVEVKKPVVKPEKISSKQVMQISAQKCHEDSGKEVHDGRRNLIVSEKEQMYYESETIKKKTKKQGSVREDRMINSQLSVCKARMLSQKLPKSTKVVRRCSKTPFKSSSQQEVTTLVKKSLNHQESDESVKNSKQSETWIVEDNSGEESHKKTELDKKDKTDKASTVSSTDSKYKMLTKSKKHLQSPDSIDKTKKRNSLFSFFNQVSDNEVLLKPEKIQVKVQIHSPPLSPSVKKRSISIHKDRRGQRYYSMRSKMSGAEDQIVVLESHTVKPATDGSALFVITTPKKHNKISDLKTPTSGSGWKMRVRLRELPGQTVPDDDTGGDSSDDHIFTPKKKWVGSKTSVQQKAARQVHMNTEQMKNQDDNDDVSDEGAEGDPEKVTRYSSSDKSNAIVKLAPLFVRSKGAPKPKVDPAIVEARWNFLKSGIPETMKKLVDMQRSMEEQYHFIFPTVAHVQQKEDQPGIWNLPLVELPFRAIPTLSTTLTLKQMEAIKLGTFSNCCRVDTACTFTKPSTPTPITCFRKLLHILKLESPDFPIYQNFRRLRLKYVQGVEKSTEKVSGKGMKQKRKSDRKTRVTSSDVRIEEKKEEEGSCNLNSYVMWTEKYKPTIVDDIVGNGHSIQQLRNWLDSWKHYSDEVQHRDKQSSRKRKDSSSGDEFMGCDSNDSSNRNLPNNTAILVGPHGCGKTSAVYAIANELGCKVLEINTSSKRNGKRILSELQEATQSHQVRTGSEYASGGLVSFFKGECSKSGIVKSRGAEDTYRPKEDGEDHNSSKMSIILVEGVDVVYEDEDEGFVSAVNALVASSKRPVILVTNGPHYPHLVRFMDLHLVLKFSTPLSRRMSVWLQLVCLLEGVRLKRAEIERLLDQNCGDVRQTMLQLQFWVLTGGNNLPCAAEICDSALSVNPIAHQVPAFDVVDDHSDLSYISGDEADVNPFSVPEHANCIEMFTEYSEKNFESCQIPFPLDLGRVWWNLASLISIPENLYWDRICLQSCGDVMGKETFSEVTVDSDESDSVVNMTGCEVAKKDTEAVSLTVLDREENKVVLMDERLGKIDKGNSEESLSDRVCNDDEKKGNLISEVLEVQRVEKSPCSQVEADCTSRLMETMSALDMILSGGAGSREPCFRSWDQIPKDGTSLNEEVQCQWWENSVSRVLCHYLLEGIVHNCRINLQKVQGCQVDVQSTRVTFTKPTQQELRWRLAQHAADETVLPAVPLWCHPYHHSVASDYIPMLRAVSRYEQDRLACNTKRRNRFFHYLKGLNVHASDATLNALCSVFASRHTT